MTKDYGHEVRFSPEHHILLKYGKNLLEYPESVKKIGIGKLNLLGTLFLIIPFHFVHLIRTDIEQERKETIHIDSNQINQNLEPKIIFRTRLITMRSKPDYVEFVLL